jgi:hypothetical protein
LSVSDDVIGRRVPYFHELVEDQTGDASPFNPKGVIHDGMSTEQSNTPLLRALTVIDGNTEELVDLHELEPFDLPAFAAQFDVPIQTDPEMLDRYAVGPDDVSFLAKAMGIELVYDFSRYAYFIEALRR